MQDPGLTIHVHPHQDGAHQLAPLEHQLAVFALPLLELPSHAAVVRPSAGSTGEDQGVSVATLEDAVVPDTAAVANAIANATGHRFRDLPISAERIKAANGV